MAQLHGCAMPIGKFFGSAYRLDARAQGVVRVHVWGQTVTSVDPTEARNAPATSVEPCRASSLGLSRCSRRPALVTRRARPSLCWTAAILPRRQSSRCRCYRTWPHPAMCASLVAAIRGLLPEHCGADFDLALLPLLAVPRSDGFSGPRAFERDSAILRRS
jgi:hypothetical protein